MIELVVERFPVRVELSDGTACTIRMMQDGDEPGFRDFHAVIPEEEQLFIRSRIKDGSLFREWMSDPESGEHIPLMAFVDGKLVATGSLHQRLGGWKRHIGKVHFLTHPDYRGLGLIDHLLSIIVEVSAELGLTKLESEINGERKVAIESMATAGFKELVRLPNYIRDMRAESHDYVLMGMSLVAAYENLGAGD
ncbi:MAG: GNAT family N-acetyltransferase [Verrucomicrobiales bacterium]|nr:GNAT family N-acetyltransferase [Verrucomicrobiales bacterium]